MSSKNEPTVKQATPEPVQQVGTQNYVVKCCVCGAKPTVADTGLCGPCCTGEADTVGGDW